MDHLFAEKLGIYTYLQDVHPLVTIGEGSSISIEIVLWGGDMNDRSRGKREFPKGFPVEADLDTIQNSQVAQSSDDFFCGCLKGKWSVSHSKLIHKRPHFIMRAYSEPLGFNLVENILLQRSYIID